MIHKSSISNSKRKLHYLMKFFLCKFLCKGRFVIRINVERNKNNEKFGKYLARILIRVDAT